MFSMLLSIRAGNEDIVNVDIGKRKTTKNLINKMLKGLSGIAKTKWHL